ncbi:MAG: hypothetical protein ABIP53_05920 [Candidatus Limnocylindrales bacterium]
MNISRDPEAVMAAWLDDGPAELPIETRRAIAVGIRTVPRRRTAINWPFVRRGHLGPHARRNARPAWRRLLFGQPKDGLLRLSATVGTLAVLAVAGVVALSALSQVRPTPAASLPTSPADWSRVIVEAAPRASQITRIAVGPRGLIAVARSDNNGESRVLFSTDGRDWSEADVPPARGEYVSVVATDRGFLMISSEEGAWTSENGLEWQRVANNWSGDPDVGGAIVVDAVAGGPGYVAVGNHNTVWYSTDGSDWALAEVPPPPAEPIRPDYPDLTVDILHVAAVGGHLVATGYYLAENSNASIGQDFVLASSDGRAWSTVLPDVGDRIGPLEIAAGPNGFLVIGGPLDGGDESTIWHSADGVGWQIVGTHDFSSGSNEVRIEDVAAAGSGYVAVGLARDCFGCPSQALLWTSPDGGSWSELAGGDPFNLREPGRSSLASVAAFGSRFVVGGQHDGRPAVWISGSEGPQPTTSPVVTGPPEATATSPGASPLSELGIFEPVAGRVVYYADSSLWGVDANAPSPGSTLVRTDLGGTADAINMSPLGWSSDGTKLLLVNMTSRFHDRQPPFDFYLYILHADGSETQVIPEPVDEAAAISPDGSLVAFSTGGFPNGDLFVVDAEGGEPVRIALQGTSPTFSRDGTQIAYLVRERSADDPGQVLDHHVWVANADGSDAHEILADEPALIEGAFEITWSPAGDRIAIGASHERTEAIYTFGPNGSDFTKVITGGSRPFWSPDGSQIAYTLAHGFTTPDGEPLGEQSPRLASANADGSNVRTFDFGMAGPWHPSTLN